MSVRHSTAGRTKPNKGSRRSRIVSRTAAVSRQSEPPHTSLAKQAYDAMKLCIISLEYRPGSYLIEAAIAKKLGFGRMPVHEAIARLAHEGMLQIIPRKGVVVRPISLDEALANIEARLVNEPAAARFAAERASADDVAGIESILEGAAPLVARRDIKGLMQIDWRYHSAIARATRNPVLEDILARLHERSLRFWFISLSDLSHLQQVHDEHQLILRAFKAHDGAAAENAVREHIESFRETIKRTI
jgi:DNA-binding GntR family transcriptional regulator